MARDKRRRRVLHLITTFPLSSGAAENTRLTLNRLDRSRFEPLLGAVPGQSMEGRLAPDVGRVALPRLTRSIRPWQDALAFRDVVHACRLTRCELVHTHNAKDGILGRWAAAVVGVPVVHTIHNVSFRTTESSVVGAAFVLLERLAARITDRILVVSEANAKEYLARGIGRPEQYQVVYSGLELERYGDDGRPPQERRRALHLPDRPGPWVAWLGRFNRQKDPLTFIRAARQVADRIAGVQFVVCGDDPIDSSLEEETRSLVGRLGLEPRVHFLGFQRDITTVLRGVDLVMHSSRYEGMGRVVCEALACERPLAGTAVDGVREVVLSGERGGLLVRPQDPDALGNAAIELLLDPVRAMALAQAGRRWVETHLAAAQMVQDIEAVYDAVLDRRPAVRGARG